MIYRSRRSPRAVIGFDVLSVDGTVNAVSPYARTVLKVRVHPEQAVSRLRRQWMEHPHEVWRFGIEVDVQRGPAGDGFATAAGPAEEAARAVTTDPSP